MEKSLIYFTYLKRAEYAKINMFDMLSVNKLGANYVSQRVVFLVRGPLFLSFVQTCVKDFGYRQSDRRLFISHVLKTYIYFLQNFLIVIFELFAINLSKWF